MPPEQAEPLLARALDTGRGIHVIAPWHWDAVIGPAARGWQGIWQLLVGLGLLGILARLWRAEAGRNGQALVRALPAGRGQLWRAKFSLAMGAALVMRLASVVCLAYALQRAGIGLTDWTAPAYALPFVVAPWQGLSIIGLIATLLVLQLLLDACCVALFTALSLRFADSPLAVYALGLASLAGLAIHALTDLDGSAWLSPAYPPFTTGAVVGAPLLATALPFGLACATAILVLSLGWRSWRRPKSRPMKGAST